MQMFKDNIDSNVEWVSSTEPEPQAENNENLVFEEVDLEDFDSEIDSDEDEAERKKALKEIMSLIILTAVGVDPNYGIYPLAYAIVKSENKQAWLLFLDCLGDDLELFRNSNFTFVTDRQKGFIPALTEIFHAAEHRQLKDGRDKPIITCLEFIREYLMKRIVIVQQVISKSNGPLTSKATKVFEVIKKIAAQYTISWNGGNLYQAVGPKGDQCVVNVEKRACFCRKWDLTESWVNPSYWLATWEEMYRFKINPCNGPDLWPPSDSPITYTLAEYHKPAGRPSKKRKKSAAELFNGLVKNGKLSRFGQTVTCCKCCKKVTIAELVRVKEGLHLHQQSTKLRQLKLLSTLMHQQSTHLKLLLTLHLRQVCNTPKMGRSGILSLGRVTS
nr:hypothetical protein [Tanacetum cinerariifolium]